MDSINIKNKHNHDIRSVDGRLDLSLISDGKVINVRPERYYPVSPMTVSDVKPVLVSDGIILILEAECEAIPLGYQNAHMEFVLTYNPDYVIDGALDSDILYKFESYKQDGWFIEQDNIYTFPGSGYTSYQAVRGLSVKHIAMDLDLNLSNDIYMFSRSVGITYNSNNIFLSNSYTNWKGRKLHLYASTLSNTGVNRYCPIAINLLPEISDYFGSWPVDKDVYYEIYVGESGNVTDYTMGSIKPLVHRNSSVSPTGFYFFDGTEIKTFDDDGIPSEYCGNKMFFVTDVVDTKKALFSVYRAFWSGGNSNWIAKALNSFDFVTDTLRPFNTTTRISIKKDTFPSRYHLHVIVGTCPDLKEYFEDEDIDDFSMIRYSFDGLIDYATTLNTSDSLKFEYYYNTRIVNPGSVGLPNDVDVDVLYTSPQNQDGDENTYVFWRSEYGLWSSSSSSSSQSFSSTSLCSSSQSFPSTSLCSSSLSFNSSSDSNSSNSSLVCSSSSSHIVPSSSLSSSSISIDGDLVVSGAGIILANGTYTRSGDYGGAHQWVNGAYYLYYYGGTIWHIGTSTHTPPPLWYSKTGDSTDPTGFYDTNMGTPPAPEVSWA